MFHYAYCICNCRLPDPDPALLALSIFQRRLVVTNVPAAYVIQVEFQSVDPDRAAQIANAWRMRSL